MNSFSPRSKVFKPFLPQESVILPDRKKKYATKTVEVNTSDLEKVIDVYRWRAETQFPIVKIRTIELLPSDSQTNYNSQTRALKVQFEQMTFTFAKFSGIPLFRMLYLLKQTLIGLERLYNKFGSFFFTEKMIFVDQAGKCKIWINDQVQMNDFQPNGLCQSEFLFHVVWMFKAKTTESKQSAAFYEGIKNCKSFFSALECLESFVERQKVKILTYFKMPASSTVATSLQKKEKKIELNMTMSKKPNFLVNMEYNSSKEDSSTSSRKNIFESIKLNQQTGYFSKPEMKISGDTAAESQKNIKSSNDCGGFSPIMYSRKNLKEKELFNSDKPERIKNKFDQGRKFSQKIQQCSPKIEIHGPVKSSALNPQNQIPQEISESMTFCDANQNSSRSSSTDNKEKLVEKKKEVFNFNGWQLKVNSLFSNDSEFQKSFCQKKENITIKKQPVKLELLDKHATNMCESFMENSGGQK